MMTVNQVGKLSPDAEKKFESCYFQVQSPPAASLLWNGLTSAEQRALGGDFPSALVKWSTARMWMRLRGVSKPRAIIDVAARLAIITEWEKSWLLQAIGEDNAVVDQIARCVTDGHLVLDDRSRSVHWKGEAIPIDWRTKKSQWNFLWILCQKAKAGRAVESADFGETEVRLDYATKTKSRLCRQEEFPRDLAALMVPAGRGQIRLELPPDQIRLFQVETIEVLRDACP